MFYLFRWKIMKKLLILSILLLAWCGSNLVEKQTPEINLETKKEKVDIVNKAVNTEEFEKLIKTWKYTLIDIRTPEELQYFGYISGMNLHLDYYNTGDMQKLFNLDKNKKYLMYCYHGNRSWVLRNEMKRQWFNYVIDLKGWIDAWMKDWKKLEKYIENNK